jgi:glutamate racemase
MKIGVFDSGIGGLSVARAIEKAFPLLKVEFVNDSQHIPYGTKTNEQLLSLSLPILTKMQADGCDVIVVACNTLTTTIIQDLRNNVGVTLVAVEPMVKPAASLTKNNIIAVCATPATLAS